MNYKSLLVAIGEALIKEPPLRSLAWGVHFVAPVSARRKALWSAARRPQYLLGVAEGAAQALKQGIPEISVIEFGVASGAGLVVLEKHAALVEAETGVRIKVFGFDSGAGLPAFVGDHRDHPDLWQPGDFRMDAEALRRRLDPKRTELILGHVRRTIPEFLIAGHAPVGFASMDLDLYSSTADALRVFSGPERRMLRHVPLYFDDVLGSAYHSFAGERLAISEFCATHEDVKIDRWHGVEADSPFPNMPWLQQMYVAHDLAAISGCRIQARPPQHL